MISSLVMLSEEKAKKARHVFLENSNRSHILFSVFSLSVQLLVWGVGVN